MKAGTSGGDEKTLELGFWSPDISNKIAWLLIEFKTPVTVMEILTQGSVGQEKWTSSYVMRYSIEPAGPHRKFETIREDENEIKVKLNSFAFYNVLQIDLVRT